VVWGGVVRLRGAWCVVRGAWCVVRGAWCVVRGAWSYSEALRCVRCGDVVWCEPHTHA
jgi:hypothetical protein